MPYSISSDHSLHYDIIRIKVSFKKIHLAGDQKEIPRGKMVPS